MTDARREKVRAWVKARALRWKLAGGCACCGKKTGTNRNTGKPYARCLKHRLSECAKQTARYHRRKAQVAA
jgi:hypothetical protein